MQLQNYTYRARNAQNQVVTGVVQASGMEAAKKILLANQLTPLAITLPLSFLSLLPFVNRVGLRQRTLFARQIAAMLQAGLSLAQAMRLLLRQRQNGRFQTIVEAILTDIQDGFSFSTALAKHPTVFDPIFVNVVRSGEATGKLEEVLAQLATTMERDVAIASKIRAALFYPAFILLAMVVTGIVMITKVIPQLRTIFDSQGSSLPAQTQAILNLSDFLIHQWYVVVIVFVVTTVILRVFARSDAGQEFFSRLYLRIPIVRSIIIESSMARFGRILSMLLGSGVPLLEGIRLLNESFTNRMFKYAMRDLAIQVERGVPMSVPISANPLFPIMVSQMIAVGEQTGKMDEVMGNVAGYYDDEVSNRVAGISSLIEPVVIIVLGLAVAYLVVAILLPVYQATTSV